jgi:anti-anti-sigma regulatory factor
VREVLEIIGLDKVFTVYATAAEAASALTTSDF